MIRILELNNNESMQYLLKEESYFSLNLPKYFGVCLRGGGRD